MSSAKYLESKDLRKGEELMIFYKDKPIAYCKSMNFSLSVESVDVSSKMSGEWDSTLPGKLSWSYDVDSMVSINPDHLSYDEMCKLAAA